MYDKNKNTNFILTSLFFYTNNLIINLEKLYANSTDLFAQVTFGNDVG